MWQEKKLCTVKSQGQLVGQQLLTTNPKVLSHVSSFVLISCILPPLAAKTELETLDAQLSSTHKL